MAQINGGGGKYAGAAPLAKPTNSGNLLQQMGMAAPAPTGPVSPVSVARAASLPAAPRGPVAPYSPPAAASGGGTLGTNSQGTVSGIASGGGGNAASVAPPAPQPMSNDSWWNQDANFQAEKGGLDKTLANAMDAFKLKRAGYDSDYVTALKNMGLDWSGAQSNSLDGLDQGQFNQQNQLGAYGRGYQNLQNDFAGRGMLDSSFYDTSKQNFNTDFANQRAGLGQQRSQFMGDINNQDQGANNDYISALERARQSSLSRKQIAGV